MALDPCVRSILCTLSTPVLNSLRTLVTGQVTQITALLNVLQARSVTLGIQLIPVEIARDAAVAVLDESQSIINLLPVSLIEGCGDLGSLQQDLSDSVAQATAAVNDFADDATRLLSLQGEVSAEIAEVNARLARASEFLDLIDVCITEAQT